MQKLQGLLFEAQGKFAHALATYKQMLEKDPVHVGAWKRRIAIHKSNGDVHEAIIELNNYCRYGFVFSFVCCIPTMGSQHHRQSCFTSSLAFRVFAEDPSGWLEVAELHVAQGTYDLAKFALEELILLRPEHYLYHLMYAEVRPYPWRGLSLSA